MKLARAQAVSAPAAQLSDAAKLVVVEERLSARDGRVVRADLALEQGDVECVVAGDGPHPLAELTERARGHEVRAAIDEVPDERGLAQQDRQQEANEALFPDVRVVLRT